MNFSVVLVVDLPQILACGYINKLKVNCCWLIQLLSLACTIKEYEDLPGVDLSIIVPMNHQGFLNEIWIWYKFGNCLCVLQVSGKISKCWLNHMHAAWHYLIDQKTIADCFAQIPLQCLCCCCFLFSDTQRLFAGWTLESKRSKACNLLVLVWNVICTCPCVSSVSSSDCDLPKDEAGIIWDSICFSFLLLQRRVFMSYYFLHVVADIRAGQILASRYAVFKNISPVVTLLATISVETIADLIHELFLFYLISHF